MNFDQRCTIPVPRTELWDFLIDVPKMATCVPGAENVIADDDGGYNGVMRVKLGPISLSLQGAMHFQESDRDNWRLVAHAQAKDRRIGGGANVTGEMRLVESGAQATEMIITGQVRFLGRLGQFGEPIIRKQAESVVAAFAGNVAAHFQEAQPAAVSPAQAERPAAPSEPGPRVQQPSEPATRPATESTPWAGAIAGIIVAAVILVFIPMPAVTVFAWILRAIIVVAMGLIGAKVQSLGRVAPRQSERGNA